MLVPAIWFWHLSRHTFLVSCPWLCLVNCIARLFRWDTILSVLHPVLLCFFGYMLPHAEFLATLFLSPSLALLWRMSVVPCQPWFLLAVVGPSLSSSRDHFYLPEVLGCDSCCIWGNDSSCSTSLWLLPHLLALHLDLFGFLLGMLFISLWSLFFLASRCFHI